MRYNCHTKVFLLCSVLLVVSNAQAGNWSPPTTITQVGSWGPWFGVVVTDTSSATGCTGTGTKAVDISTSTPTSKAQMALLLAAHAQNKKVQLYFDYCTAGTSVITNVQIVP